MLRQHLPRARLRLYSTFLRVPTCSYLFLLPQISSNFLQLRRTSSNLTKHFAVSLPSMTLCRHQASYCLITAYLSLLLISFPTLFYFLNLQLSPTSCVVTAVPLPSMSLCRFRAHDGVATKHTTVSLVSIFIFVSRQSACVKISAWVLSDSAFKNVVLFEENSILPLPGRLEASGVESVWGEVSQESPEKPVKTGEIRKLSFYLRNNSSFRD